MRSSSSSICWLSSPMIRLWSLRRFDGIPLGEGDPRHEVAAERRLRIEARHRGHHLAGGELEQRGDDAGRAHVHGDAEGHGGGVPPLDGERPAPERHDGHLRLGLAERRRQRPDHVERNVHRVDAGRQRELLEVGRLMVLLLGQLDVHQALLDAGVHRDARPRHGVLLDAEDLEGLLVQRRRDLRHQRLGHGQLAGQTVSLAHQVVAELELVVDRAGRWGAPHDLHPTGRAAPAPAAGRGDVDALGVGRAEEDAAGIDDDGPAVGQDRHDDGWHAVILDDRTLSGSGKPREAIARSCGRAGSRRYSSVVEQRGSPAGRLDSVRVTVLGAVVPGPLRLEPGRVTVALALDGLPVAELPAGARLRIGGDALVELGPVERRRSTAGRGARRPRGG